MASNVMADKYPTATQVLLKIDAATRGKRKPSVLAVPREEYESLFKELKASYAHQDSDEDSGALRTLMSEYNHGYVLFAGVEIFSAGDTLKVPKWKKSK